ncbi:Uncharacterized protein MLTONO_5471 [Mesorhizobium loti]|nr:Uncharacterized protein MLTONO_5471 [Mesorhizobium loti]
MAEQSKKKKTQIAILGWGSLIWDVRPEFDNYHDEWLPDGPVLPLEFSRISESRKGALTLVIDPQNGAPCTSAYALSTRSNPDDAIADLRCREGTIMRRIGFYFRDGSRRCEPPVPDTIAPWADGKGYDVVIWTGLPSNFRDEAGKAFSVVEAISHLQALTAEGKGMAAAYVWSAPDLVRTPLRTVLQIAPWFPAPAIPDDAAEADAEPPTAPPT